MTDPTERSASVRFGSLRQALTLEPSLDLVDFDVTFIEKGVSHGQETGDDDVRIALGSSALTGLQHRARRGNGYQESRRGIAGRGAGTQEVLDPAPGARIGASRRRLARQFPGLVLRALPLRRLAANDLRANFLPLLAGARRDDCRPDPGGTQMSGTIDRVAGWTCAPSSTIRVVKRDVFMSPSMRYERISWMGSSSMRRTVVKGNDSNAKCTVPFCATSSSGPSCRTIVLDSSDETNQHHVVVVGQHSPCFIAARVHAQRHVHVDQLAVFCDFHVDVLIVRYGRGERRQHQQQSENQHPHHAALPRLSS